MYQALNMMITYAPISNVGSEVTTVSYESA